MMRLIRKNKPAENEGHLSGIWEHHTLTHMAEELTRLKNAPTQSARLRLYLKLGRYFGGSVSIGVFFGIMLLSFKLLTTTQALLVMVPAFLASAMVYLYASLLWGPTVLILGIVALIAALL